jgi:hypothetical protein
MRGRKAVAALAGLAVCGALVLGGCGGGDSTTTSTEPAKAMKDEGGAMKHEGDAMKHEGDAMKDGGAMHDEGGEHGEAMKDG